MYHVMLCLKAVTLTGHDISHSVVFEGYDVERCEEDSTYWEAVPGVVSGTSHVVKGLVEGTRYKFRVKAQNVYGISEPVTTDKSILAKNPFGMLHVSSCC